MDFSFRRAAFLAALCALPLAPAHAQNILLPAQNTVNPAEKLSAEVRDKIVEGRSLLEDQDPKSLTIFREASQASLRALNSIIGKDVLKMEAGSIDDNLIADSLVERAAEAHYYYGTAAQTFNRRDEAITAYSRSQRLANLVKNPFTDNRITQNTNTSLGFLTSAGLPLIAPDDVIRGLATYNSRGLWKPKEINFTPSALTPDIGGKPLEERDFLVTSGQLFVPQRPNEKLFIVPPYYRQTPVDALPLSLQPNQMIVGYAKELYGANAGQWRQIVRVFYASPRLTVNKRDDRPRAEKLVEEFLKVHSLFQSNLGLTNLYTRGDKDENVTTLWLLEVSALWPNDEDDPTMLGQLGPAMPTPNTGPPPVATEPKTTPLMKPWSPISGQVEASPGEILFWKSGLERPEAEWMAEITHEYGHVSLPPIGGFRPPLESYGNGVLGETLGMLWAAANEKEFGIPAQESTTASQFFTTSFKKHVDNYAFPSHQVFLKNGPQWFGINNGSPEALRYMVGLSVYLERVYGAKQLGRAFLPLAQSGVAAQNIAARRSLLNTASLLNTVPTIYNSGWNGKVFPIWLPGAMSFNRSADFDSQTLINRGEVSMRNAQSSEVWLYVPKNADSLRIEGVGAGKLRSVGLPFQGDGNVTRVFFGGNTGWQRFSLTAGGTLKISNARFERK